MRHRERAQLVTILYAGSGGSEITCYSMKEKIKLILSIFKMA